MIDTVAVKCRECGETFHLPADHRDVQNPVCWNCEYEKENPGKSVRLSGRLDG